MAQLTRAERLLQDLGVTEPKEIDLEAIAFHLGARVLRIPRHRERRFQTIVSAQSTRS
jgi:hypothetical protein